MRISHRYRFIFFASPKTGSSTVRQFLDPWTDVQPVRNFLHTSDDNPFYPHMLPSEVQPVFRRLGWDFDGYHKFIFVRNPWARLVSLYEHIRAEEALPPFSQWLLGVEPGGSGAGGSDHQRWRRYGAYSIAASTRGDDGSNLVDTVLRLEDMQDALIPHLRTLGLPIALDAEIPHRNRREGIAHYTQYYSNEAAERVAQLYALDIERYGYRYGD